MASIPKPLAVIGDFFVDLQAKVPKLPEWDRDVETPAIEVLPGGSAGNTARQLFSMCDGGVRFFSTCSDDPLGVAALHAMTQQGFDTSYMTKLDLPSSACIVLSGPSDRGFVSCYSTVSALTVATLKTDALKECRHVHVGGYLGNIGLHTEEFITLLEECRQGGATISLGTQTSPTEEWLGQDGHLKKVLPLLDILLVNEHEIGKIESALGLPVRQVSKTLTSVVTHGKDGVKILLPDDTSVHVPTAVASDPVDTTGAGDAFNAGFLYHWTQTKDATAAAAWGNATAACCIMQSGGCPKPVPLLAIESKKAESIGAA
eukprot:TRINITY_DN81842_c0_g1_i1.p1 TRINITY_DN81842_c0_g1~~TRINITY_DN81842_c0_g1_i1.p1  ORF type:complete len:339 (+),score=41.65 TRINITY_DN81842_c0_g1_i1:67-1017(+)